MTYLIQGNSGLVDALSCTSGAIFFDNGACPCRDGGTFTLCDICLSVNMSPPRPNPCNINCPGGFDANPPGIFQAVKP